MLALGAAACEKKKGWVSRSVDPSLIKVESDLMVIATGEVGVGKHQGDATYALVDAVNNSKLDLEVTLAGHFLDGQGSKLGEVTKQSLRINSGARRTFALVAAKERSFPDAVGAEIEVAGTLEVDYPPPVQIEEGHVYDDRGRAVVKGYVHNTAERPVRVIVIASFYDKDGRPVERPSTLLELAGAGRRGVHFVGPDGSVSAALFVGETVY